MFCGKCGNKIDEGARFCPSCGAAVEQAAAPVQSVPEPEPVPVQSVPEPEPVPVQSVPESVPVPESVQTELPAAAYEDPEPELMGEVSAPEEPEPVPAPAPLPENTAFTGVAQPEPAPAVQPEPVQYPAPSPIQPAKKKKSKAGIIAGIAGGVVVLAGAAAAVGYFCFHSEITKLFMGDKEYARMISRQAVPDTESADGIAEKVLPTLSQSVSETYSAFRTINNNAGSESGAYDSIISEILGNGGKIADSFGAVPEGVSLSTESSVNVKPGSVFAMLNSDSVRSILDIVNNSKLTAKAANGSTKLVSVGISDKDGNIGSAELYTDDSGMLITFPGISDQKIFIPQDKLDGQGTSGKKPAIDPDELKRIRTEIADLYYAAYDNAEITYTGDGATNQSKVTGGSREIEAGAAGRSVTVTFTAEQVQTLADGALDIIKNDSYLMGYAKEAFGLSEADYKKLFDSKKDYENKQSEASGKKKPGVELIVSHIYDGHNKILSTSVTMNAENGDSHLQYLHIPGKESSVFRLYYDVKDSKGELGSYTFACGIQRISDTDGFVVVSISAKDTVVEFNCDFTGKGKAQFMGRNVTTGKYVFKPSDPDKFIEALKSLLNGASGKIPGIGGSDGITDGVIEPVMAYTDSQNPFASNEAILEELKKVTFTYECTVDGDIMTTDSELYLGDIGSLGYSQRAERREETVTMPDKSGAVDISDNTVFNKLQKDALTSLGKYAEKIDGGEGIFSTAIKGALDDLEKTERMKKHYAAYTNGMSYRADALASELYYGLCDTMRDFVADKTGSDAAGVIGLYFTDGKCEVLDGKDAPYIDYEAEDADNVYAEIIYDNRYSEDILGVNVVYTDDRYDIPEGLPTAVNFLDTLYQWEGDRNYIGDFVVGNYPKLWDGEPTTGYEAPADVSDTELLEQLNEEACLIADAIYDFTGSRPVSPEYIYENGFSPAKGEDMFLVQILDGEPYSYYSPTTAFSDPLQGLLHNSIQSVYEEYGVKGSRGRIAAVCFNDGIFAGVAVYSDAGQNYNYESDNIDLPTALDHINGSFGGWYMSDSGETQQGFVQLNGNTVPLGTYSVSAKAPLGAASLYDGTWAVTEINGMSINELIALYNTANLEVPDFCVVVNGEDIALYVAGDGALRMKLIYGKVYDGKSAAEMRMPDDDLLIGYLVFDGSDRAHIVEEASGVTYTLVLESRAAVSQNRGAAALVGKYSMPSQYDDKIITISSNGVITNTNFDYVEDNYFVTIAEESDPDGSYKLYSPVFDYAGQLTYDADAHIITIIHTDGTFDEYMLTETRSAMPYQGKWTVESMRGMSPQQYADNFDYTPDEVALNMELGEYSAVFESAGKYEAWSVMSADEEGCKIAYDSSMFFDCKYDAETDKLNVTVRYDDTSQTYDIVFVRGSAARG